MCKYARVACILDKIMCSGMKIVLIIVINCMEYAENYHGRIK